MVTCQSTCSNCNNTDMWRSQPLIRQKPAGNILIAAGLLFSGCTVTAVLQSLWSISVQVISSQPLYIYQKLYLLFAINKAKLLADAADNKVDLAGDGHCDSPGHNAKYLTCLLNDMRQLSPDMETFSLEAFNSFLIHFMPNSTSYLPFWGKARCERRARYLIGYVNQLLRDVVNGCTGSSYKDNQHVIIQQPH
ncbi:uncharacterized protein LOC142789745 [Rhipicephalus microplus]|uniref:uncharacterized protein LOC142789745 n=1 Tax=Rhipicephalus microplus TaxID=6941 RepID=UPI003F6C1E16